MKSFQNFLFHVLTGNNATVTFLQYGVPRAVDCETTGSDAMNDWREACKTLNDVAVTIMLGTFVVTFVVACCILIYRMLFGGIRF